MLARAVTRSGLRVTVSNRSGRSKAFITHRRHLTPVADFDGFGCKKGVSGRLYLRRFMPIDPRGDQIAAIQFVRQRPLCSLKSVCVRQAKLARSCRWKSGPGKTVCPLNG